MTGILESSVTLTCKIVVEWWESKLEWLWFQREEVGKKLETRYVSNSFEEMFHKWRSKTGTRLQGSMCQGKDLLGGRNYIAYLYTDRND